MKKLTNEIFNGNSLQININDMNINMNNNDLEQSHTERKLNNDLNNKESTKRSKIDVDKLFKEQIPLN